MGRLVIKFPTRNRPEKFKAMLDRYICFLSGQHQVRFVISLDEDDPSMNNEAIRAWLDGVKRTTDLKYVYGHSKTKIEAFNADMEGEDGEVLLVGSDDMNPVERHYDVVVFDAFARIFPDFYGAVKFWDGHRSPGDPLMTLAVMGFPLYRRFGYIYNPEYLSVHADNEQTEVCLRLKRLAFSPVCIMKHEWTSEPFDVLHARNNSAEMYRIDGALLAARRARGFDMGTKFGANDVRPGPAPIHALLQDRGLRRLWQEALAGYSR
jgi:hypothetical protein